MWYELAHLLNLSRRDHYAGPAANIINAIFKVMTEALQRGETITIEGLGRFEVREWLPKRKGATYWYKANNYKPTRGIETIPARKTVVFIPSRPLVKSLNIDNPKDL